MILILAIILQKSSEQVRRAALRRLPDSSGDAERMWNGARTWSTGMKHRLGTLSVFHQKSEWSTCISSLGLPPWAWPFVACCWQHKRTAFQRIVKSQLRKATVCSAKGHILTFARWTFPRLKKTSSLDKTIWLVYVWHTYFGCRNEWMLPESSPSAYALPPLNPLHRQWHARLCVEFMEGSNTAWSTRFKLQR